MYKKQKIFFEKQKELGMACHIPPLKKAKKQGEMPLPSLGNAKSFLFFEENFLLLFVSFLERMKCVASLR